MYQYVDDKIYYSTGTIHIGRVLKQGNYVRTIGNVM